MKTRKKVLLVDDDQQLLLLVSEVLCQSGVATVAAASGEDALRELDTQTFSCMITDLHMPGMTGLELAKEAKKAAPAMQVILCTGAEVPHLRRDAFEAGVDKLLQKPLDVFKLLTLVRQNI